MLRRPVLYRADVGDFAPSDGAHSGGRERSDRHRLAVERDEFDFVTRAALMHENDGADVTLP